jgi:hypothetical protein
MRTMTRRAERDAWTAHLTGEKPQKANKYRTAPKEERGGYASKHEMEVAAGLHALQRSGQIFNLQEQVRFELIPKNERFSATVYVSDFVYTDQAGAIHVLDAKGVKTAVYQLKKKLLWHVHKIAIEEV